MQTVDILRHDRLEPMVKLERHERGVRGRQTPSGPRKSGILLAVEIPAPVNASTRSARVRSSTKRAKESVVGTGSIIHTFPTDPRPSLQLSPVRPDLKP